MGAVGRRRRWMHVAVARASLLLAVTLAAPLAVAPGVLHAEAPARIAPRADAASLPLGSLYHVVDQIGARRLWRNGIDGAGVNVAIIDTGVSPVPSLAGSIVASVDLSAEAGVPEAAHLDTYGHGTHIAGIIAGTTPGADPALAGRHPEWFMGVAPRAGIVSVKVADNTGAVDVSQVIAGIDWVVEHAAQLHIRVINLSYSSGATVPYTVDPLAVAVERAWKAGIVVVAAAGNDGRRAMQLAAPARDPWIIAVSGLEATSDVTFTSPSWASSGDGIRNPDIAAPGAHIDSARAPFGRVSYEHPEGIVSDSLFRGSGSSQAAAVVSGAVALLLQARPDLTPDQVKHLLRATADDHGLSTSADRRVGKGLIHIDDAVAMRTPSRQQSWPESIGTAPLDQLRTAAGVDVNGNPLAGNVTVLGTPWIGTSWTGNRWSDGTWSGTSWTGGTWMGTSWTGTSWTGTSWTGTSWTGTSWTGTSWTGTSWTGTSWTGTSWTGTSWTGTSWTGTSWTGTSWTGTSWTGGGWT